MTKKKPIAERHADLLAENAALRAEVAKLKRKLKDAGNEDL